jgi:hypothetical protein
VVRTEEERRWKYFASRFFFFFWLAGYRRLSVCRDWTRFQVVGVGVCLCKEIADWEPISSFRFVGMCIDQLMKSILFTTMHSKQIAPFIYIGLSCRQVRYISSLYVHTPQ